MSRVKQIRELKATIGGLPILKLGSIICAIAVANTVTAQNLVPNGNFEDYDLCPDNWFQITRSLGWDVYHGTPDYFNACSVANSVVGVPWNGAGYQEAIEGEAYAGVITFFAPGSVPEPDRSKEVMGIQLSAPLVPGVPVYLSFKASPATGGIESSKWTTQGIGMRFSTTLVLDPWNSPPNTSALHLGSVPLDTANWLTISGVYIPDSAYEYVLVGNFYSDSLLTPVILNENGNTDYAYMYIDDICISFNANDCDMSNSISTSDLEDELMAWPVPFESYLHVELPIAPAESLSAVIFDIAGSPRWYGQLESNVREQLLDNITLPSGMYVLRLLGSDASLYRPLTLVHLTP